MTCYASTTETTGDTVGSWHDLESFYDSLTGKSPLMHLCRMCHDRSEAVHAAELVYSRVGANPSDTAFGALDYDANPTWNPLRDIHVILSQIHSRIAQLAGQSLDTDTCIKWYYIPTATVSTLYSAYNSAISGSSLPNKEDWLIYINAMKTFLEGLSGLSIQSVAWTSTTGSVNLDFDVREGAVTADVGGINTAGSGSGAGISGTCPAIGIGTTNGYWIVNYNTDQEFGDITWNASASGAEASGRLDLAVGIQDFDGSLNSGSSRGEVARIPYPLCSTITEDEYFATYCGTGWFQITKSKRRFYLIKSTTGGMPSSALTGKTFNWTATLKEYDGSGASATDSDIPHTFVGAGSGSFVVGSGGSIPAYIDVEVELDGDIIDAGADPFSGGYYEEDLIWIAKAGILVLEITPGEYNYCKTGCNTYVEDV